MNLTRPGMQSALAILATSLSFPATAQDNYVAFELMRENNWAPLVMEDVNGDGAKDLIFSHFQPGIGRELHIHPQQADGNFASNPQRIEIKTEIIAVGFADLRPEPGVELVLLANSSVFSLSTALPGYAGNLKPLLSWDLIADIPSQESVPFFSGIQDINGDGLVDLLLPGDEQFGVFLGVGNEQFTQAATFTTLNQNLTPAQRGGSETDLDARLSINSEEGVVVELRARTISPFDGFVEDWQEAERPTRSLLRSENWMPSAVLEEFNGDGLTDLIYLNVSDDGLGQLNIHWQRPDGGFGAVPDWQGSIDTSGDLELADLDGDGLTDLMRIDGESNEWDVRFYLNEGGRLQVEQPKQIMRFSGYDVRLDVIALEPGATPLLSVNYYTIPVVEAIRNASINRVQLLYGHSTEADQLFERRPATRLEESFSASNVRGLAEQMSLQYDVDGDGRNDALYVTENGTLAARRIGPDLQIAPDPFWEYISPRNVFEFEVVSLNGDDSPDLVLRHGTSMTLLVAQP